MKKYIVVSIIFFGIIYILININIKIVNQDVLRYSGTSVERPSIKKLDDIGFYSYINEKDTIFVHRYLIVTPYHYLFINKSRLADNLTIDSKIFDLIIKRRDSICMYSNGNKEIFTASTFITFGYIPDSILYNSSIYHFDEFSSNLPLKENETFNLITIGPIYEWF